MSKDFISLGINKDISDALKLYGITEPTPVQSKLIPAVLSGKNIAARSETGTGKTFAYLLPVLMMADSAKRSDL